MGKETALFQNHKPSGPQKHLQNDSYDPNKNYANLLKDWECISDLKPQFFAFVTLKYAGSETFLMCVDRLEKNNSYTELLHLLRDDGYIKLSQSSEDIYVKHGLNWSKVEDLNIDKFDGNSNILIIVKDNPIHKYDIKLLKAEDNYLKTKKKVIRKISKCGK